MCATAAESAPQRTGSAAGGGGAGPSCTESAGEAGRRNRPAGSRSSQVRSSRRCDAAVEGRVEVVPERLAVAEGVEVLDELDAPRPERPEAGRAAVGRILAPEELARELVVQPDEERLDEARVRPEERDHLGLPNLG